MAITKIFTSYTEFLTRKDKSINGVSQGFINRHPNYKLDNDTGNTGCWNCLNCYECNNCFECTNCFCCNKCNNCNKCNSCNNCNKCNNLDSLDNINNCDNI